MILDEPIPAGLDNLVFELSREPGDLSPNLHPDSVDELADIANMMACYYSNLLGADNTCLQQARPTLAGTEVEQQHRAARVITHGQETRSIRRPVSIHEVIAGPGPANQQEATSLALAACDGIIDPLLHDHLVDELADALALITLAEAAGRAEERRQRARRILAEIETVVRGN